LDERISQYGVDFLKEILSWAIGCFQQLCPLALPLLQAFRAIYLVEGTFFSYPRRCKLNIQGR
jgi:hypothetical protein